MQAIVPFFSSSVGYGILWDSASRSALNALRPAALPFLVLSTAYWGQGSGAGAEGKFTAQQTGVFVFYAELCSDYGCSKQSSGAFDSIEVTVGDVDDPRGAIVVVQNWAALSNLPNSLSGKVHLQMGHTYHVKFSGSVDNGRLFVIEPSSTFSLSSRHSSFIDYYVSWSQRHSLLQPLDSAVRGYRSITGDAPPYALWAYGFWQSKEHYATQAELLNASTTFRSLQIPVDNIVQDWRYWGSLGWGPQWDKSLYPDPAAMIAQLHKQNFRFMISVWSRFDNTTTFYDQMRGLHALVGRSDYYGAWRVLASAVGLKKRVLTLKQMRGMLKLGHFFSTSATPRTSASAPTHCGWMRLSPRASPTRQVAQCGSNSALFCWYLRSLDACAESNGRGGQCQPIIQLLLPAHELRHIRRPPRRLSPRTGQTRVLPHSFIVCWPAAHGRRSVER
jgi:hypothetical protein